MSYENQKFKDERSKRIAGLVEDNDFRRISIDWMRESADRNYTYNFSWLGRPIIQYPQDIQAIQELIWEVKPDLVIETGIAHGGSLIFSASMLALLDLCEGRDPWGEHRKVIGIDIDIRPHNRAAIEQHPMSQRIEMIEGNSIAAQTIEQVKAAAVGYERVLVCLDSMHSHQHVLSELDAYSPLVSVGSYCVVFDTAIEDLPVGYFADRPWDVGNNPKTAVHEWIPKNHSFKIDREKHAQTMIGVCPDGFLLKIA